MFGRRKVAALVAEFMGTGALTLVILSVQRSTIGVPFFVAAAAGLIVVLMSLAVGATSGGYFNPAITLGMWTARKINAVTALLYVIVEFLGAWGAYYLYTYFVNSTLQPIGGKYKTTILVAEIVGTLIFSFGFAAAIYQRFSNAVTASTAGLGLMLGIIAASSASLGLLNPAVALGVRAWTWAYVVGPLIGAVIGINLYRFVFAEPETVAASASPASVSSGVVVKPVKKTAKKKTSKKK